MTAPVYAWTLLHNGVAKSFGHDYTGKHESAQQFADRFAALPHPTPVDEVRVWAGEDRDREPDVVVPRTAVAS